MNANLLDSCAEKGHVLPCGSEERGVLGVGKIPVALRPSGHDMKTIPLYSGPPLMLPPKGEIGKLAAKEGWPLVMERSCVCLIC